MIKNDKKHLLYKLVILSVIGLMVSVTSIQGLSDFDSVHDVFFGKQDVVAPPMQPLSDPYFTWEDDFATEEYIDPYLSYDYELIDSVLQIKNTYPVWTDPSWTRLKPVTLSNTGGIPLANYAVHVMVEYDVDMQPDYDDIRFKHQDFYTTWLDYWVETADNVSASVWVKIPVIPAGTSMLYLFYGNPSATSQSDFYSVFTSWEEAWANDEKMTAHLDNEGTWDPEVEYGAYEFLVLWEEGQAYYPPYTWGFKQEIRGSMYDSDGELLVSDWPIYNDYSLYYRNENPSAAYGGGTFFVAWEHYDTVSNPLATTMDIKARTVKRNGAGLTLGPVLDVCTASNCQADPYVVYDSVNHHFCVIWEDARNDMNNYNLYGRLYDTNGNPVGSEKVICSAANNQCEPWVAFDAVHEQFLVAWEEGIVANTGPFSIKAGFFNHNLDPIGTTITVRTGTTDIDYNFPCVSFSELTQRFLITYNDADISDGDWYGNIWGALMDTSGVLVVDNFILKSGNFIRTNSVPYLSSSFLVTFDNDGDVWGKLVSSDGYVFAGDVQMSASSAAVADWANMAFGDDKIFIVWEDTRIVYPPPWNDMPDVYGNIWRLNIPSGSEVTVVVGTEKHLILTAQVTSKPLAPENLVSWHQFNVVFTDNIMFTVLDGDGTTVLISGAGSGEDLSGIDPVVHPSICLQAAFSRTNPSYTPTLDVWNIIYVGTDDDPPETTMTDIVGTLGLNGWYVGNVKITLSASDGQYGTGVNHTYFRVDDGEIQEYDDAYGIKIPLHATGDPNTLFGVWDVWYWSVDRAGNSEDPQGPVTIKIDKVPPYCTIWEPADRANVPKQGGFWVQTLATDNGSGIQYVSFDVGPPYEDPVVVTNDDPAGSGNYKWWCDRSFTTRQWKHIIAQAYDDAGHMYEANIYVYFTRPYSYSYQFLPLLRLRNILEWFFEFSFHHFS